MYCELCGAKTFNLQEKIIEGAKLSVCQNCGGSKHSKNVFQKKIFFKQKTIPKKNFTEKILVEDYGKIIKNAREKKGLTIKKLAGIIKEKESYLHRIENQQTEPDEKTAKKIEKTLSVTLYTILEEEDNIAFNSEPKNLTLADLLRKKHEKS